MARTKQFNEDEVLQKAVEIFWKQGYNATSMDDLVKNLGINRASLYDTFGGKKQLFQKAINRYISDNTKALNSLWNEEGSVREGIKALFDLVIEQAVTDSDFKGCLVVNTSTELVPGDGEICETLSQNKTNFEAAFYHYLKKGQEKGEIKSDKDIRAIAVYLVTVFNGLKVSSKFNTRKEELRAVVDLTLKILD